MSNEKKSKNGGNPPTQNPPSGGSNATLYIVIVIAALIILFMYLNSKKPQTSPVSSPTATKTMTADDAKILTEVLTIVKENPGKKSKIKLEERLNHFKKKEELDKKLKIEVMEWDVQPAEGVDEPNRYYDVTYKWKENDKPVVFMWRVDSKNKAIAPINESSRKLDEFEGYLISVTKTPDSTPKASPEIIPMASPSPGTDTIAPPSPVEISPVPTASPKVGETPDEMPSINGGEETPYKLVGIVKSSGTNTAMLQKDGRGYDVKVGTKLPQGWIVTQITSDSVVIKKGSKTSTITMKQIGVKPKPYPSPQRGSYPKAKPKPKKEDDTHSSEGPSSDNSESEPTIIPTE